MKPVEAKEQLKTVIDREKMMQAKTCAACGRPFNLGDPVVLALGSWEGPPQFIHAREAVYDAARKFYVARKVSAATGHGPSG